jgi:lipopolysaccharide/colanic/teichoic acid biosynthesis glycosyltransferase
LDAAIVRYGVADPITVRRPFIIPGEIRRHRFNFLVGEITGLLFILLSSVYILVMPSGLARAGALKTAICKAVKRTIDILGAAVGLVLTAPLMLLVAVAVKIDSPGPLFYTQTRVGVNRRKRDRRYCRQVGTTDRRTRDRRREDLLGRPFSIVKIRTMVADAEKRTGPVWASKNDDRITRVGRILRKTRIDEIPQFWSVLKGDMSLVGPRPERPSFVRDLCVKVDDYQQRLEVKPGLTGLAQVENGYDSSLASVREKVRFDLKYIRGWSIWTDVRILLKTVVVVVTGKGAC